jgi:hypothetical protein
MKTRKAFLMSLVALGVATTLGGAAIAQSIQDGMGHGMMRGDSMMHGGARPGMMGQGMRDCMERDAESGMMGSGMMRSGMQDGESGMGALFGSRVTRMMNLSVDDVRAYLAFRLERLKNKRLKLGDVAADDGMITADVVTVDNSLVQRLKVDRHTGAIEYQN